MSKTIKKSSKNLSKIKIFKKSTQIISLYNPLKNTPISKLPLEKKFKNKTRVLQMIQYRFMYRGEGVHPSTKITLYLCDHELNTTVLSLVMGDTPIKKTF